MKRLAMSVGELVKLLCLTWVKNRVSIPHYETGRVEIDHSLSEFVVILMDDLIVKKWQE